MLGFKFALSSGLASGGVGRGFDKGPPVLGVDQSGAPPGFVGVVPVPGVVEVVGGWVPVPAPPGLSGVTGVLRKGFSAMAVRGMARAKLVKTVAAIWVNFVVESMGISVMSPRELFFTITDENEY